MFASNLPQESCGMEDIRKTLPDTVNQNANTSLSSDTSLQHSNFHQHKHHHHHHHSHHILSNLFRSKRDFQDSLKNIFHVRYSLCYVVFFLAIFFELLLKRRAVLLLKGFSPFLKAENYYQIQEYTVFHLNRIQTIPMWIAIAVIVFLTGSDYLKKNKKFLEHFLKALPALIASLIFAIPRPANNMELLARNRCINDLKSLYVLLSSYAETHSGDFPDSLSNLEIPKDVYFAYGMEHYEYAGGEVNMNSNSKNPLVMDAAGNHAGNYRLMLLNDGTVQVSKYGKDFVPLEEIHTPKTTSKSSVRLYE